MNNSGDAAEQIVRMSLDGVEVAARITGAAAKEIALFLVAALKNPDKNLKHKGKARLASMLKSGKPLEIFSLKERDLAKFAQGAKQYGIVYCVLRNKKSSPDGLCDIMVKADDAPKISRVIERFAFATVDKAKIASEIVAEKAATAIGAEPSAPVMAGNKNLHNDIMGTKEGKAGPEKPEPPITGPVKTEPLKAGKEVADNSPFGKSGPRTSPPSGHILDSKKKPAGAISSKPSVREAMREIAAARKKGEPARSAERPAAKKLQDVSKITKHKQPPRGGKTKLKIGGNR